MVCGKGLTLSYQRLRVAPTPPWAERGRHRDPISRLPRATKNRPGDRLVAAPTGRLTRHARRGSGQSFHRVARVSVLVGDEVPEVALIEPHDFVVKLGQHLN